MLLGSILPDCDLANHSESLVLPSVWIVKLP